MELLLTGATGFVGRNLLLKLLSEGQWKRIILPVRDPDKLRSQLLKEGIDPSGLKDRLVILKVSGDSWQLPGEVRPELAIHAAGLLFAREKEEYFQTNVSGSLKLVSRLPESCRIIVLSSLAAGGPTPWGELSRRIDHADKPASLYGASKLAMEQELRKQLASRLLILRPPMVLGPRDAATVPLFKMAKGLLRFKPGFKPKHYSWIAVEDLCEALLEAAVSPWPTQQRPLYLTSIGVITDTRLIEHAGEVINTRGVTLSLPHAAIRGVSWMMDVIPALRDVAPSLGPDRVREILPNRWVCDGGEFERHFDWRPRRDFSETLQATAAWLRSQGTL
jgi:nucleoside-diphosphate-sugar epimerase